MKLQCKLAVNVNAANLECNFVLNSQTIGRVHLNKIEEAGHCITLLPSVRLEYLAVCLSASHKGRF